MSNVKVLVDSTLKHSCGRLSRSWPRWMALAILVSSMRKAAEVYGRNQLEAVSIMSAAYERFSEDALRLGDEDLSAEVDLTRKLLDLMKQRAPQGDLYGRR